MADTSFMAVAATVLTPVLTAGLAYYLGGKRKLNADIDASKVTSDVALVNAATSGFEKAMSTSHTSSQKYLELAEKFTGLSVQISTLDSRIRDVEEELKVKERQLVEIRTKNRLLAHTVLARNEEIREKDSVIKSLVILVEAARKGDSAMPEFLAKAEAVLTDFIDKYNAQTPSASARAAENGQVADAVEDALADETEEQLKEQSKEP